MYSTNKLSKIIKINAFLMGLICSLRVVFTIYSYIDTTLFENNINIMFYILIFVIIFIAGYLLSKNIWSIHSLLFFTYMLSLLFSDIVFLLIFLINKKILFSFNLLNLWKSGLIALICTIIFLIYGFINEQIVVKHTINIKSSKIKKQYSFVAISDIHFGTIQNELILKKTIQKINKENFDAAFLLGDIAEEKTSRDNFKKLFAILKELKTKKGIYFVYGNHDKQEQLNYNERTYSNAEFHEALIKSNIICLEDEILNFDDFITIIGRKDYSQKNRKNIYELLKNTDENKLRICLDHQPTDLEYISKKNVDVCLCAHLHGGQNWPNNLIYKLSNMYYNGKYILNKQLVYVNAGIAGSKYIVRTHGHCEYLCLICKPKFK